MKISTVEKINPLQDHLRLKNFAIGQKVEFRGKSYTVARRTTLASGEPALVLQSDQEQFVVAASQFLAEMKEGKAEGHGKNSDDLLQ